MNKNRISKDWSTALTQGTWKPWFIASVSAILVLVATLVPMAAMGLFNIPKDDTGTQTLAAALGLVGSIITAVVTLFGLVIKSSIDQRNALLAIEAEKRNKIEAAIRAVGLLSENNKDSTPSTIGGAVLALVSLGELDLAVALLAQLWPNNLVSADIAGEILKKALKDGDDETKTSAATVLARNGDKIDLGGCHIWPIYPAEWETQLPDNCRLSLVRAASKWLKSQLANPVNPLADSVIVLYQALDDPNLCVKDIAASCLRPLVQVLDSSSTIYIGNNPLSFGQIAERLKDFPPSSKTDDGQMLEDQIRELLLKLKPSAS